MKPTLPVSKESQTLKKHRDLTLIIAFGVLLLILVVAFFLPLPHDPHRGNPAAVLLRPNGEFWWGTDIAGRDVFSRTLIAARLDLPLALAGTAAAVVIGVPLGLLVAQKGRRGEIMMRLLDVFQAFPLLILAIALVTLSGNRLDSIVVAIAIINVPRFMRLIRSQVLSIRESKFIEAALAFGVWERRLLWKHIMPNVTGVILAQSSLAAAHAILVIAGMSFLGIGITPPDASWGSMIQAGSRSLLSGQWWPVVFPGAAIFLAVASMNVIAQRVSDTLERRRA